MEKLLEQILEEIKKTNELLSNKEITTNIQVNANTGDTKPSKSYSNTPKGEEEVLGGVVAYPEVKQGKKAEFMTFKLCNTEKGDVQCKSFDKGLFEKVERDAKIIVKGFFQEYKGYSSFVVNDVMATEPTEQAEQPTEEDSDDVPF